MTVRAEHVLTSSRVTEALKKRHNLCGHCGPLQICRAPGTQGYAKSQRRRKKLEEPFGLAKTVGGMAQTLYHGIERACARVTLTMAACDLPRPPKLLAA